MHSFVAWSKTMPNSMHWSTSLSTGTHTLPRPSLLRKCDPLLLSNSPLSPERSTGPYVGVLRYDPLANSSSLIPLENITNESRVRSPPTPKPSTLPFNVQNSSPTHHYCLHLSRYNLQLAINRQVPLNLTPANPQEWQISRHNKRGCRCVSAFSPWRRFKAAGAVASKNLSWRLRIPFMLSITRPPRNLQPRDLCRSQAHHKTIPSLRHSWGRNATRSRRPLKSKQRSPKNWKPTSESR